MSDILLCPICDQPVKAGDWFLIVSVAEETVRTGTPYQGVPQRPVHMACVANSVKPGVLAVLPSRASTAG